MRSRPSEAPPSNSAVRPASDFCAGWPPVGQDGQTDEWMYDFDEGSLAVHAGACLLAVGQPESAGFGGWLGSGPGVAWDVPGEGSETITDSHTANETITPSSTRHAGTAQT